MARISIAPASPSPKVLALICAPSSKDKLPAFRVIPPAVPTAPDFTWLKIPLRKPWLDSPLRETESVTRIVTAPASPSPNVLAVIAAPVSKDKRPASRVIPPEVPTAPCLTVLKIPLTKPWLSSPLRETESVTRIWMAPASPTPKVLALISAPFSKDKLPAFKVIPPAVPTASDPTVLKIPLPKPWLSSPLREMSPVAVMSIAPASPMPTVLAESCAPSIRDREFVAIVIPPAFPTAPGFTLLKMAVT